MKFKQLMVAVIILTLSLYSQVGASVVSFDGLVGSNGDPFTTYNEDGFTVASWGSSNWVEAHYYGNPVPDIFTAYSGSTSQSVSVTTTGLFVFSSVDLSTGSGVANYTIRGLLSAAELFVLTGSDDTTGWTTVLGDGTTAIDTLIITQTWVSGYTANIDNISVTGVPEPTTMLLLGFGLVGLAGLRRK